MLKNSRGSTPPTAGGVKGRWRGLSSRSRTLSSCWRCRAWSRSCPALSHSACPAPRSATRPGTPRQHQVRDQAGAAGDPAPHREEPVQPTPADAERAPTAQAGPAPEAPGSPAGLRAPQLAHAEHRIRQE